MKAYKIVSLFFIAFTFFSCKSFVYEKKIINDYYILGVDLKDELTVSRRLNNGDYIGRVPANVIEYGVNDSLIIAKSSQNGNIRYYIINMKKDSEYGRESDYLIGPLNEDDYVKKWQDRFSMKLISVK